MLSLRGCRASASLLPLSYLRAVSAVRDAALWRLGAAAPRFRIAGVAALGRDVGLGRSSRLLLSCKSVDPDIRGEPQTRAQSSVQLATVLAESVSVAVEGLRAHHGGGELKMLHLLADIAVLRCVAHRAIACDGHRMQLVSAHQRDACKLLLTACDDALRATGTAETQLLRSWVGVACGEREEAGHTAGEPPLACATTLVERLTVAHRHVWWLSCLETVASSSPKGPVRDDWVLRTAQGLMTVVETSMSQAAARRSRTLRARARRSGAAVAPDALKPLSTGAQWRAVIAAGRLFALTDCVAGRTSQSDAFVDRYGQLAARLSRWTLDGLALLGPTAAHSVLLSLPFSLHPDVRTTIVTKLLPLLFAAPDAESLLVRSADDDAVVWRSIAIAVTTCDTAQRWVSRAWKARESWSVNTRLAFCSDLLWLLTLIAHLKPPGGDGSAGWSLPNLDALSVLECAQAALSQQGPTEIAAASSSDTVCSFTSLVGTSALVDARLASIADLPTDKGPLSRLAQGLHDQASRRWTSAPLQAEALSGAMSPLLVAALSPATDPSPWKSVLIAAAKHHYRD